MRKWPEKQLGELVSLEYGKALKSEERSENGRYPVYGSNGIVGSFDEAVVKHATIVVGRKGAIGEAHLALKGCWPIDTAFYTVLRQPGIISLPFLLLWFRSVNLKSLAITATIPGLNRDTLYAQKVPLPPLPEQERIVKLLDEADALRKLRNQADKRSAEIIPALFNEMFGDPAINPFGWKVSTLSSSCIKIADGTHFSPPPVSSGVPYITAKHLRPYGLDFYRDPTYVSSEKHNEIYKRCDPRYGDVLYIKDGATTGIAAINHYNFEFSMLSSLALLRCEPTKCCSEYLCEWLNNKDVKSTMLDQMSGSAIKRLTLVKIKNSRILLPPIVLQKEFAASVSEFRAMVSKQSSSCQSLDALFQSMLHRAFQGEL
jgi:type I restriction enzyme S subunit